jgi:TolB protein
VSRLAAAWLLAGLALPAPLAAQDTTPPAPSGVRVGITYTPGTRPSIAVLVGGGSVLDSARAILGRDLDYSDRFDVVTPPGAAASVGTDGAPDYRALNALGTDFAVSVAATPPAAGDPGDRGGFEVVLHDVRSGTAKNRIRVRLAGATPEALRRAVHQAADDVVHWATGGKGIASSVIFYVADGKIWRVDPDGADRTLIPTAGRPALSPTWSPDGHTIAYTAFVRSGQPIVLQDLVTGHREVVPGTEYGMNITPVFSPDGRKLAFAHGTEDGTDIYVYDLARRTTTRLTVGRYYDNLSPAWSPDGQRIAFISTRAGGPQLYVMSADGTGQEALARFDYGFTGMTYAPEWSPDGQAVVFHREVGGVPQIFVLDLATRAVKQITGEGRNEDATWAPDGRHLCFVSSRGGTRLLWIVDLETGRMRQLFATVGARLPAWSPGYASLEGGS